MIKEVLCKTALHYHNKTFATNYDLNIYRGCEHRCKYCFAQYSSLKFLESDFFDDFFVKTNIAQVLDKELSKNSWNKALIHISAISDCYQPLEKDYKLMREVLKILIKHKQPVFILTKSDLILRDLDLFDELCEVAYVNIALSIATTNEELRKKLEPNASSIFSRFNVLKEFSKLNCKRSILMMPVIPYLTDSLDNLENIYRKAKEFNVDYISVDCLNMRGNVKKYFYDFLKENFPTTYERIQHLYESSYVSKNYLIKLRKFIYYLKNKYKIYGIRNDENLNNLKNSISKQMDLFE